MYYSCGYSSPLGPMTAVSDGQDLIYLGFDAQRHFPFELVGQSLRKDLPVFDSTGEWLDIYFNGRNPDFVPRIRLTGTPFRLDVWRILMSIEYGSVTTYKSVAMQLLEEKGLSSVSFQAVGSAIGHNPVSIIIPCHRVINSRGGLSSYAGGLDRKKSLLKIEKAYF